ncbi:MAG TPA: lipoprotein [Xanthobacteraceae bacterium]|nr:lipoprotein [Xanthobacteraceae bacterium]
MASNRLSVARALTFALALPLALCACGRKGPLDPPPSAAIPASPPAARTSLIDPTTPTGGAQQAQPAPTQTTQAPKKTFFLDGLIQ